VEIVGEARDGNDAVASVERLTPDLVILDIQMPGRTGLSAASVMAEPRPELVFVTAHEHYAADAFDVDAADYLLKPVRFDRLRQAVERAKRRRVLRERAEQAGLLEQQVEALKASQQTAGADGFWIPEREAQRRVPMDAIDWIEAAGDYVMLHTELRSHLLRATMASLEERLEGSGLLRVHRSAFVRPSKVAELRRVKRSYAVVMSDGAQVQVSTNHIDAVRQAVGLD
jgi:DNA-binding LytR/AlgR family response regulator